MRTTIAHIALKVMQDYKATRISREDKDVLDQILLKGKLFGITREEAHRQILNSLETSDLFEKSYYTGHVRTRKGTTSRRFRCFTPAAKEFREFNEETSQS